MSGLVSYNSMGTPKCTHTSNHYILIGTVEIEFKGTGLGLPEKRNLTFHTERELNYKLVSLHSEESIFNSTFYF